MNLIDLTPFSMGELYEGSRGLPCDKCGHRPSMVWLTGAERATLPNDYHEACLQVCAKKMGVILCKTHQPRR